MSIHRRAPMLRSEQSGVVRSYVTHVHRCDRCGGLELCPFECERSSVLGDVMGFWQGAPALCEECKGAHR